MKSGGARPFVLMNMAMTADGKIANARRTIESFGSRRDQAHLHGLRATADAVLCGAHTAGAPEITLGTGGARYRALRRRRGLAETHLAVLVSGRATLPRDAAIFTRREGRVLVLVSRAAPTSRLERLRTVADEVGVFGSGDIDLPAALCWLRKQWGVRRLVCEGGATLNDAMFRAGLVDELHLTIAPYLFGGRRAPTLAEGLGFGRLGDAPRLELQSFRRVADEVFLVYRVPRLSPSPT